jgi:hypothetical protein
VNDGDDASAEAANRTPGADVHGDALEGDMAVERRRVDLDVVDPDHFPPVDVDNLLVEEVALEQEQPSDGA